MSEVCGENFEPSSYSDHLITREAREFFSSRATATTSITNCICLHFQPWSFGQPSDINVFLTQKQATHLLVSSFVCCFIESRNSKLNSVSNFMVCSEISCHVHVCFTYSAVTNLRLEILQQLSNLSLSNRFQRMCAPNTLRDFCTLLKSVLDASAQTTKCSGFMILEIQFRSLPSMFRTLCCWLCLFQSIQNMDALDHKSAVQEPVLVPFQAEVKERRALHLGAGAGGS